MSSYRIPSGPRRIVCLTEEPTEILYSLGEDARIVGISAYTKRPPEAMQDKPIVSAFIGGSIDKICALKPDLVIGFSDIQANLARDLIAANQQVLIFNQRSVQEILDVIVDLASLVGCRDKGVSLVESYVRGIEATQARCANRRRPKVYFEEWNEPMITGIQWVSELIEIAGGEDVFAKKSVEPGAKGRVVTREEVAAAAPEVILASWCGKPFERDELCSRPEFAAIPAVVDGRVHEVPAEIILQPGPACLTDGLASLERYLLA